MVQRWAMGWMIRGSSPGRSWEFFSPPPHPDRLWSPPILLSNVYQVFSPGGKAVGAWSWHHRAELLHQHLRHHRAELLHQHLRHHRAKILHQHLRHHRAKILHQYLRHHRAELLHHFFTTASRLAVGPIQSPIQWVSGSLSLGVKRPGREADHSPPSSTEVKERKELYFHSPNMPTWRGAHLRKAQGQIYLYLFNNIW
jgi:hypothetical protein